MANVLKFSDVKRQLRYKNRDLNEVKFSDYDVKMATNEALRYISNAFATRNADFVERTAEYSEEEINAERAEEGLPPISFRTDGVDFPEDYSTMVSVVDPRDDGLMLQTCLANRIPKDYEYKIVGNKIYTGCKVFRLMYKMRIPEVDDDESIIDLPVIYLDALVDVVTISLQNEPLDSMLNNVNQIVDAMVPRRRYRNSKVNMQFKV